MKRSAILFLTLFLCFGCATTRPGEKPDAGFLQRHSESKRLAAAVTLLQQGNNAGAVKALEAVCSDPPVPGVTDEALFRLALLSLKPSTERPASSQFQELLKRLRKEYPASPWTAQAAPLVDLINSAEELRRQNKTYRSANQSLTKDVNERNKNINELNKNINELNKNIEQLKHLDLEIEKKTR
jgi:TolA-binding protein